MGSKKKKKKSETVGYFDASRRLAASYVFVAPLFAVYQVGLVLDEGVRNGTAPILRELFHRFQHFGLLVVNLAMLGFLFLAIWRTRTKRRRVPGLYGFMLIEAVAWTGIMVGVATLVTPQLLSLSPLARQLFASAGAGIYEEVLFRFLLMGGLVLVFQRGLGGHPYWVVPLAIAASALLFSYAHHALGGQDFGWGVFWYRTIMGVILGAIFFFRGLGLVVYAHALYNVALVILQHANG